MLWFVTPLGPDWLVAKLFDSLARGRPTHGFWLLLVGLIAVHIGSALLILAAHRIYMQGVESAKLLARTNVVHGQLASGGPSAAPRSVPVGDVLARLRDDPFDVLFLLDNWIDMSGSILFGLGIDPVAALAGIVPMLLIGFGNRLIGNMARRFRGRARAAASDVGHFLNAAFEASLTVKVSGARRDLLRRFDELTATRAHAAVRDSVTNELVWTINNAAADVFVGLALVVAARRHPTAGQVTLFASYLVGLVWLPMRIGSIVVGRRRYAVSAGRLDALLAPGDRIGGIDRLVEHRDLPVLGGNAAAGPVRGERRPLERLTVRGLTIESRGLRDIDLTIERGSLTVVTGAVGCGKTSLLRGLIGLLDIDAGMVRWNGVEVHDRAAFFVPPQCAFVAQVPRMFAESLADNLRLGHQIGDQELFTAIETAAFDVDVAELPEGLETLVGARGVRLSGGQAQRAAGARAIAHRPELLVLDDLTSALDVETEIVLWERLAAAGFTVLAASNRPVALARADNVLEL
jgi:ATP-binding cassette subfamily B protein